MKIQNIKAKLFGLATAGGTATALFLSNAHAVAVYTIDPTVQTGITDLLSSFVTGAFGIILVAVTIVGGYYVTVRLVHVLLKWFHKFA